MGIDEDGFPTERDRTWTNLAFVVGATAAIIGAVWLATLILLGDGERTATPTSNPPTAAAEVTPPKQRLESRLLLEHDLETGSREFSAVALNEATERLVIADDENRLFEFDLDDRGVPITPPRRTMAVTVGSGDIEGIAWLGGTTYMLAHENTGMLTIVDLDDGVVTVDARQLLLAIETGIDEVAGNGVEGVTPARGELGGGTSDLLGGPFVVVDERPPALTVVDGDGSILSEVDLSVLGAADVSDIARTVNGYAVLSDEARVMIEFRLDADNRITELDRFLLEFAEGRFEQPEGLAWSRDGQRLYVVGESPGPGRFSFGYFRYA